MAFVIAKTPYKWSSNMVPRLVLDTCSYNYKFHACPKSGQGGGHRQVSNGK
jgi:hypothetical protein